MTPRRVAILKPSALGDICHALPVLSAFRDAWPAARITWVANRGFAPLLEGHPDLTDVLPFDRAAYRGNPARAVGYSFGLMNELRRRRFDLVVDLQGLMRTGLMAAATGAPVRVGFADAREGSRHAYTHPVVLRRGHDMHAVERYWAVAEAVGAGGGRKRFVVPLKEAELSAADALLAGLPRPWLAVAAGARWVTKRWPAASFVTLLNGTTPAFRPSVVLVGAGDDVELHRGLAAGLAGPVLDLTGRTTLPRLAAVLSRCDAMLANDTGPLHLAAALGVPCVAPYTCTQVRRHGPYPNLPGGVETQVPCAGSYFRQCPNGLVCFGELTPDRLRGPLERALTQRGKPPS